MSILKCTYTFHQPQCQWLNHTNFLVVLQITIQSQHNTITNFMLEVEYVDIVLYGT